MQRITAYLGADHDRLHLLLATACAGDDVDGSAYAQFRAGLLRHIAIEEKLLFPAIRAALGAPFEGAVELHVGHAAIASLLVPTPDLALCGELAYLLGRHNAEEEGPEGVYAVCEDILGEAASVALAAQARAYREVRVSAYFDGPTVKRTAAEALAAARRRPGTPVS